MYLVDEYSQEAKSTGKATVGPLNQEQEEMCSGAIRQPHLKTRTVILS